MKSRKSCWLVWRHGIEGNVRAVGLNDYQELSHLLEEKEREDAVLSDLMEQWESAADLLG